MSEAFAHVLSAIRKRATDRDQTGDWPAEELAVLAEAGAMRWVLPAPYGDGLSSLDLHLRYESLAAASLAVALIFTQRDSAVQIVEACVDYPDRDSLLRKFAANDIFSTVGIAQLTTSRQHGKPAMRAAEAGGDFLLDGYIPWSTSAAKSDLIVAGATLADHRQILFLLPRDLPGVSIDPSMPLVSLRASWTTQIRCNRARLPQSLVLRGPMEKVLGSPSQAHLHKRKGVPFGQVFLALGLCRAAIDLIAEHHSDAANRARDSFGHELTKLREQVLALCAGGKEEEATAAAAPTRAAVNDLAIRATHAAVALYKGSALLADHPAQRFAREAMFLLVWSCPGSVIDCTVDRLIEC